MYLLTIHEHKYLWEKSHASFSVVMMGQEGQAGAEMSALEVNSH